MFVLPPSLTCGGAGQGAGQAEGTGPMPGPEVHFWPRSALLASEVHFSLIIVALLEPEVHF